MTFKEKNTYLPVNSFGLWTKNRTYQWCN